MGRFVKASNCCIVQKQTNSQLSDSSSSNSQTANPENSDNKDAKSKAAATTGQKVNAFIEILKIANINVSDVKVGIDTKYIFARFYSKYFKTLELYISGKSYSVGIVMADKNQLNSIADERTYDELNAVWKNANTLPTTYSVADIDGIIGDYSILKKFYEAFPQNRDYISSISTLKGIINGAQTNSGQYYNMFEYMKRRKKYVLKINHTDSLKPFNKYKFLIRSKNDSTMKEVVFTMDSKEYANPTLYPDFTLKQ